MRWIGNVVLLCLCLGTVAARPIMAQGVYRVIAPPPDTTVIEPDTTVQVQKSRTRLAIQPYIGGSNEFIVGSFRVHEGNRQGIRPLVGARVRLYPSITPMLSLDLAGHFQLPGFRSRWTKRGFPQPDTRLSQATIDANMYLRENTKKVRPYLTVGAGRLWHNTNREIDPITFLHSGIGVEIAKSKRITIPVGFYTNYWTQSRGDQPAFNLVLWYMTIGFNFYLN